MAVTFSEALSRSSVKSFQWATVVICMLILVFDGIDMQLLGILAPVVIEDYGVDRGTFGIAMSAALIGMGIGAWAGGWLGDQLGRRNSLAIAVLSFGLATIAASLANDVWSMAALRLLAGLGFGAAYANALAMGGEWLPERWRPVAITTLSVGTPAGGAVAAALVPTLLQDFGWRGSFVFFGTITLLLLIPIMLILRDSPSFLLARGKTESARKSARKVLEDDIELAPEPGGDAIGNDGRKVGVLHRSNLRLNLGIGVAFAASTMVAFGVLNWATTFLTVSGFTLEQAAYAVSVAGITAIIGSIGAGELARRFGSKTMMASVSAILVVIMTGLAIALEAMPASPTEEWRILVGSLVAASAAVFSAGIATIYVIISFGYPPAIRSAAIGFGIFMGRVGAILASGFGGALIEAGNGSLVPFFAVMVCSAVLICSAAFVADRHIPPARKSAAG